MAHESRQNKENKEIVVDIYFTTNIQLQQTKLQPPSRNVVNRKADLVAPVSVTCTIKQNKVTVNCHNFSGRVFSRIFPLQRCCLSCGMATFSITDQPNPIINKTLLIYSSVVKYLQQQIISFRYTP